MNKTYKQYPVTVEATGERKMSFTISTAAVDRDGDTIDPKGWDLKNYQKNPVVLWAHDYSQLPVGKAINITSTADGLKADVEFPPLGTYPFADTVHDMVKAGFLNATSVGFAPIEHAQAKGRERGYDFSKQELLEFSIVPVPSNPEALAQRGLKPEQAKAYAKSMRAWADTILGKPVTKKLDEEQFGQLSVAMAKILSDEAHTEKRVDESTNEHEKGRDAHNSQAPDVTAVAVKVLTLLKELPKPTAGEKQDEFFSRCMANPKVNEEFPDEDQRAAMCTARWTGENDPAEGKELSNDVVDIKEVEGEIVWNDIAIPEPTDKHFEFDAKQVSELLLSSVRDTIREMAVAQTQAAINRLTGRLD
jgi:HK97 family phage prohead protease